MKNQSKSDGGILRKFLRKLNPVIQPFLAIAVFFITVLQFFQTEKQNEMSKVQTAIAQKQQEIAVIQESIDLLTFVREYINGYVYLYDIVSQDSVQARIEEIRGVDLPALAVPSQYSKDHWLIVSHALTNFTDKESAKKEILNWRESLKGWEYTDKSKTKLFEKYEKKFKNLQYQNFVFFYKADIITNKKYFERLVRSPELFVKP